MIQMALGVPVLLVSAACHKPADNTLPSADATSIAAMASENGANPDETAIAAFSAAAGQTSTDAAARNPSEHYVYTESNEAGTNRILVYRILPGGSLRFESSVASGGAGTGAALGSQGALALDGEGWLYAVNAGSGSVSSFRIGSGGRLTLWATVPSGGAGPNSLTVHNHLLYVLNHGSDQIAGFRVSGGKMKALENATRSLSGTGVDAPQISFTPDGRWLMVTEKATNTLTTFLVTAGGEPGAGIFTPSAAATPFGFAFSRDFAIVSNAAGGAALAGSATSYRIGPGGMPTAINGSVADGASAPCWFAVTQFGRFAYTTNAGSNTISSYYVAPRGALYLVHSEAAATGVKPLDIVVAANNYFVFELNAASHTIGSYHREALGGLAYIDATGDLPESATGLATF